MVYFFDKIVKTKTRTYVYKCMGEAVWENGKSKRLWQITIGREDLLGTEWQTIKKKLAAKKPDVTWLDHGSVSALLSICKDLDLARVVDRHVDKREQGFSVGQYMTILVINRAVALNSKREVKDWFAKTTLASRFAGMGDALTPQNIWNQMGYLDQETIRSIEQDLCKAVLATFNAMPDCFLFDPTNFFTYIREHERNTIAQRGHNKKKRYDLRQINTSLLVTRGDCNLPMMHETYAGNIPDVSHFKDVIPLMEQRFLAIGVPLPRITLVYDKGNNSDDAYRLLDKKGIHFVTSVRPSLTEIEPLLAIPLSRYKVLWSKEEGNDVLGYRTSTDMYLGKKNTLVVTFDNDTFELHEFNLDKTITKAINELSSFASKQLNKKPQWSDKDKVATKIDRDILATKKLKALIPYVIVETRSGLKLTWKVDETARTEALKDAGKSFIFTNQNKWSTFDIVKTYRAQKGVEDQFKALNDREQISVMPMYHYTDQKIRAHVFISVLALLISNLLYRKLQQHGIEGSMKTCFDLLDDIKEITLDYGQDLPPEVLLTSMLPVQKEMARILDLEQFTRK
jgi:transposase